jgi:hypothetical protein
MRLDIRSLALAGGAAATVAFAICALAVAVAPGITTEFLSFVTHYDLTDQVRRLTPGSFIGGLLAWGLGTAAFLALVGWWYNLAVERRHALPGAELTARQG